MLHAAPEKWDSITRKHPYGWPDLLQSIDLLLVDEIVRATCFLDYNFATLVAGEQKERIDFISLPSFVFFVCSTPYRKTEEHGKCGKEISCCEPLS